MEKENWINEILDSTDGLQPATPDAALFSRIEMKIGNRLVSTQTIWLAAASIAALVALNLAVINQSSQKVQPDAAATLAASIDHSNQFYR
ncbi:hypothetical protein [Flavobacterium sp.]|uniref:hypothetical protein n=1 Tax=Flavobacterium sp. TaxID=239 RepID=UPI0039E2DAC2